MCRQRLIWLVPLIVSAATLAIPSLRAQADEHIRLLANPRLLCESILAEFGIKWDIDDAEYEPLSGTANRRLVAWVEKHYPNDPEMLMAAGALMSEASRITDVDGPTPAGQRLRNEALRLLSRAIYLGAGAPARAAYCDVLLDGPRYERVGTSGHDPADREAIAEYEQHVREWKDPQSLLPDEAEPLLDGLRGWQQADPSNGVPVALEAWVLYGLHRDSEALKGWKRAGRSTVATTRYQEVRDATRRLLELMGSPRLIAAFDSSYLQAPALSLKLLRSAAMARYEGRRAQIAGQGAHAVELWMAAADLGGHMQASADTIRTFMYGLSVQQIGATPAWVKHSASNWVLEEGWPPPPRRYYYGAQHAFFVQQVGQDADAALRDRLVTASRRLDLWSTNLPIWPPERSRKFQQSKVAYRFVIWSPVLIIQAVTLVLLFTVLSVWPRKHDPIRSTLAPAWRIILGVPTATAILPGLAGTFVATVATRHIRPVSQTAAATWRENFRRVLPSATAFAALLYFAANAASVPTVNAVTHRLRGPEMAAVIAEIGADWHNPTIPPGAWRAQYPPTDAEH